MNTLFFISPLASFLFMLLFIPIMRKASIAIGLVDKPNFRKVHVESIPLLGGVSIFIATTLALSLTLPFSQEVFVYKNTFIAVAILLIMGVIDDRYDLRASLKLGIQIILAHFVYSQGIMIESLHGILGIYQLEGWLQYVLTIIVVAGVVNAFNLMDGIDGLAAGLAILGFSVFAVLAFLTNQPTLALVFITYIGALIAFLRFNLSSNLKIFMGDAGSLIIGFIMAVSGIQLIQNAQDTVYIFQVSLGVIAILFVPVIDALRVFRRRIKSGKSPFSADRTHLHHLMLTIGLRHKMASLGIVFIVGALLTLGFIILHIKGITFALVSMLILFYIISSLLQFNNKINLWKARILAMESAKG